jgi:hypothetical protein
MLNLRICIADQSLDLHLGLSQDNPIFEPRRLLNRFRQGIHLSNNVLLFLPHEVLVLYLTPLMSFLRAQIFYLQIPHLGPHLLQTSLCHILQIIRMAGFHLQGRRLSLRLDLEFAKCCPLILLIPTTLSLLHLYLPSLLDTTNLRGRTKFLGITCMHRSHGR